MPPQAQHCGKQFGKEHVVPSATSMAHKPHSSWMSSWRLTRSRGLALAARAKTVVRMARRVLLCMVVVGVCGRGSFGVGLSGVLIFVFGV